MKKKILKKYLIVILLILQIMQLSGNFIYSIASIKEGDTINLRGDHECDSLVEYWMEDYNKWSYKIVWYVYYIDKEDKNKYPAFCIEPAKEGVGTGYDSYDVMIKNENDNRIWRVLNKGYMGSNYNDWNLECDDDLYSATKIALHSISEGIAPKDKYILGTRSVDGNTVEEIQRRGRKVLEVSQNLYEYGINGKEIYESPKVEIIKKDDYKVERINSISYYIQNYKVIANKDLKSYEVEIEKFPKGTKILNMQNQEQIKMSDTYFKVAIPINEIKEDIKGNINIKNAFVKTNPIFYCQSSIKEAQSYVTYASGYEIANTSINLNIKANNCNLQILKLDKETRKPIEGVTFEVQDENKNKIAEVTTNKDGIAKLNNIYPNIVTIKEIKVPDKYVLSEEEKQIKLEWGKTSQIQFENELKKGSLKIEKVDIEDNNIKLENVEFELYDNKGSFIKKLVTDKNGEVYIENLNIGMYYLKEIKTDEKYMLNEELRKVEVKYNSIETITVENEKIKGQIKILKISEDDNLINGNKKSSPIENVEFEIRKESGEVVETLITDDKGIAISSKLEKGVYIIKETKSHKDYEITNEEFKIQILENGKIEEIIITNLSKEPEKPKLPRTGF